MKILAFSDLHLDVAAADRILEMHPEADLVLGAGDFAVRHKGLAGYMERLEPMAGKAIYVAGNNESADALRRSTSAAVLQAESCTRGGLVIVGLGGGIPPLPAAPFESWDMTEAAAEDALRGVERCDVLLTHSPPKGIADQSSSLGSIGSVALRHAVERLQPSLMVFGHVHDAWGMQGAIGSTRCRNLGPSGWWVEL